MTVHNPDSTGRWAPQAPSSHQPRRPVTPDAETGLRGDVISDADAASGVDAGDASDVLVMDVAPGACAADDARISARRRLREFLSAVPRAEVETTLTFLRPDGTVRTLTRATERCH